MTETVRVVRDHHVNHTSSQKLIIIKNSNNAKSSDNNHCKQHERETNKNKNVVEFATTLRCLSEVWCLLVCSLLVVVYHNDTGHKSSGAIASDSVKQQCRVPRTGVGELYQCCLGAHVPASQTGFS